MNEESRQNDERAEPRWQDKDTVAVHAETIEKAGPHGLVEGQSGAVTGFLV